MTLLAVSLSLQILLRGARALDRPAAKTRETRAPSTTRMVIFVSCAFRSVGLRKTRTRLQRHSGLAYLEIRSRNEEAINYTRNMIYSLKVFYFLLYRRRYFLFVSELI